MAKGLPKSAKVGVPGKSVSIDPATYFIALRMEQRGLLRPGGALMLAGGLAKRTSTTKGKRK